MSEEPPVYANTIDNDIGAVKRHESGDPLPKCGCDPAEIRQRENNVGPPRDGNIQGQHQRS